jgi:hypothetical protein
MKKIKSYLSFINESNKTDLFQNKFKSLIGKEFTSNDLESMINFIKESDDLFDKLMSILFTRYDFQDTFTTEDREDLQKEFNMLLDNKDLSKEDIANCILNFLDNIIESSNISSDEELKKQIMYIL